MANSNRGKRRRFKALATLVSGTAPEEENTAKNEKGKYEISYYDTKAYTH
jgi:hypothetical protein